MPSMVNPERSLLAASARNEMRMFSKIFMKFSLRRPLLHLLTSQIRSLG
jgi:hypothetical protein